MNRRTVLKLFIAFVATLMVTFGFFAAALLLGVVPTRSDPLVAMSITLPLFILALLFIFLAIGIGIFVYRDSRERGMEPVPWVLVSVLIPYFIGFIAYLLVRKPIQAECLSCGFRSAMEVAFCPRCGKELKPHCVKCDKPMMVDARFCPSCGAEVGSSEEALPA